MLANCSSSATCLAQKSLELLLFPRKEIIPLVAILIWETNRKCWADDFIQIDRICSLVALLLTMDEAHLPDMGGNEEEIAYWKDQAAHYKEK